MRRGSPAPGDRTNGRVGCTSPTGSSTGRRRPAPPWWRPVVVGVSLRRRRGRSGRRATSARRTGRRVRLRRPDAQLPGRQRHQRPPARRVLAAVLVGPSVGACAWPWCSSCRPCCSPTAASARSGLNIINMALVTALGGYAIFLLCATCCPKTRAGGRDRGGHRRLPSRSSSRRSPSSSSTRSAAPATPRSARRGAMVGVHVLIGIGEAVITGLTVAAVLAVRPDLVYGARAPDAATELRRDRARGGEERMDARSARSACSSSPGWRRPRAGLLRQPVRQLDPDGLNKVAIDKGFDDAATDHAFADAPSPATASQGVDNSACRRASLASSAWRSRSRVGGVLLFVRRCARSGTRRPGPDAGGHDRPRRDAGRGGRGLTACTSTGARVHRWPAEVKIAATVAFVFAVVATPREALWAFARRRRAPRRRRRRRRPVAGVARRLLIELPFLVFAVFLPFVGRGERVDVLGLSLSVAGLWGAVEHPGQGHAGCRRRIVLARRRPCPSSCGASTGCACPGVHVDRRRS